MEKSYEEILDQLYAKYKVKEEVKLKNKWLVTIKKIIVGDRK